MLIIPHNAKPQNVSGILKTTGKAKQPDLKETTSLQQYRDAIDFLQTPIQLLDASRIQTSNVLQSQATKELDINNALGLNVQTFDRLIHATNQAQPDPDQTGVEYRRAACLKKRMRN